MGVRLQAGLDSGSITIIQAVEVNGILAFSFTPGEPADANFCTSSTNCIASAAAWLDLDRAEDANPGLFLGRPLEITVIGRAESGDGFIRLQILAELIKKK